MDVARLCVAWTPTTMLTPSPMNFSACVLAAAPPRIGEAKVMDARPSRLFTYAGMVCACSGDE